MTGRHGHGPRNPRKGEPSSAPMRQAFMAGLAMLVRGSSRRIHDHVGRARTLIHEYQSDQPSAITSSVHAQAALLRPKMKMKRNISLDGSLHIRR